MSYQSESNLEKSLNVARSGFVNVREPVTCCKRKIPLLYEVDCLIGYEGSCVAEFLRGESIPTNQNATVGRSVADLVSEILAKQTTPVLQLIVKVDWTASVELKGELQVASFELTLFLFLAGVHFRMLVAVYPARLYLQVLLLLRAPSYFGSYFPSAIH
jgi:hypothetical protein